MASPAFLEHFRNPRGQGTLPDATHRGAGEDATCGDRLELDLKVVGGLVEAARFRVRGCAGSVAVASALCTLLPGRAARVDPGLGRAIEQELGGLPGVRAHALDLALRTFAQALEPGAEG